MADSRLTQVITGAWNAFLMKLKWNHQVHDMTDYLKKALDEQLSLEEACQRIFAEGFAAGTRFGKASIFRECERRYKIN